ncbi:hypothetical protein QN277_021350 [Acacia crassicarpa]|uniref:Nuclear pore complex protein NUP160 n=1 Tax=Acacia crassicarpa TaxID=499986 RepID=A0AAE1JQ19_9FABA|nr:hypothetical protein QN277_021350 [Acacia crassicarpa]
MGSRSTLAGKEVPIISNDAVKWIELSVPSSSNSATTAVDSGTATLGPPKEDLASCSVIGNPSTYLIWRIQKMQPQALELLEIRASHEFPKTGLRFTFPDALCPFAFICKNEITATSRFPYLLYVLTVSGVAYLLKIRDVSTYSSCSVFPAHELTELNVHNYLNHMRVTAVTATSGFLVLGRNDGSICCFQLGVLDPSAAGFVVELRDEVGISRLWGLMSRGKMVSLVQDMVIYELHGQRFLFVLHFDGSLRVWDLACNSRVFSHTMGTTTMTGAGFMKLWVGEPCLDSSTIPVAILYRHTMDESLEMISIHNIQYNFGDRIIFSMKSSSQNISLEEGGCIDVKLTSDKIWILKDNELISHMCSANTGKEEEFSYALQEEFVADQLFQGSDHLADEILQIAHSLFSSSKDDIVPFVSSIFLRRLLLPGVHHNAVLHATLVEYKRQLVESEFQVLTTDGLKKEILSAIEHEVGTEKMSIFQCWKYFCTRYFHNWCKINASCGLLIDSSTGVVGLIRKSSVSLFRSLEDIERILEEEGGDLTGLVDLFDDDLEHEVPMELFRCVSSFSQQLGKTASSIFYEALLSSPAISSEDIIHCIVKILETGYGSLGPVVHTSVPGNDMVREKELADHRNLRRLSIDMFLSLQGLYKKAASWGRLLNVIEGFLKFLVPHKTVHNFDSRKTSNVNSSVVVHATYQIAKVMFESAWDFLLFLSYLLDINGQIHMSHDDITRIQIELVPMLQETIFEWLVIIFLATTPSAPAVIEDFDYKLSSLQIDNDMGKRSWNEKLGRCDFTLAFIFLLNARSSSIDGNQAPSERLSNMQGIVVKIRDFVSWIIYGQAGGISTFLSRSIDLSFILFKHGQYGAAEQLLTMAEAHLHKEKTSQSMQEADGGWCIRQHLLGCALLAQVQCGLHGTLKEKKVSDAVRCFFRSPSGNGASEALQSLPHDIGLPYLNFGGYASTAVWKLHYYQWAMQLFEQYNINEGACQFALAALEQVDEALSMKDERHIRDLTDESATTIKGRLWSNVFKFALDLGRYFDAYCAIISNPDEESKYICLRRFIIVLYEQGSIKILCSSNLPLTGLMEKVEQELAWKAERSDISAKPNLYKLLYTFQMHQHNWRRAANYMYLYSARLRTEVALKDYHGSSLILQERLNALSAAINALHLVHPAHAWIDPPAEGRCLMSEQYPSKKARRTVDIDLLTENDVEHQSWQSSIYLEKLEHEFVLTSAEYMLSLVNVKWTYTGKEGALSDLADLLVQNNLCDMAFTVLLRFFKGSGLKRELERVFSSISLRCCLGKVESTWIEPHSNLLTSSKLEMVVHGSPLTVSTMAQPDRNSHWATLELYLGKYCEFHWRLPVIVAETLLRADAQIDLPRWLVQFFKEGQREKTWGMAGRESNPASLFQLYVNYGRFTEATNLLLEFMESFASMRPADIIRRKKPFAVWFPYTTIERLLYQLEELIRVGHMVDQCQKLKKMLYSSLHNHLKLLKEDSDDAISVAC